MKSFSIFIVEDDPWYGEILEYHLSLNSEYQIFRFSNAKDCIKALYQKPDLITIDYSLPDMNGAELFRRIRDINKNVDVMMISGQENISIALDLVKSGISDYFIKDDNTKDFLWNAIIKLRESKKLKNEIDFLRNELKIKYQPADVLKGESKALKNVFALINKSAKSTINVSISGETGTGKELVAKSIHFNSDRSNKPFVTVNMAAIPPELIESELFGYEKGAFTGAVTRKTGKFEEANKGTIFLDEIGELNINLQSKILRVLQEREVTKIGSHEVIKLDVRVIVATHKDLAAEVEKGNFREDLFYRIMGLPIELPPLRQRENDVILLAEHFLQEFAKDNKQPLCKLHPEAITKLMNYNFPGNIRELKAIVDLGAVICDDDEIVESNIIFKTTMKKNILKGEEKTMKDYNIEIIEYFLKKYNNNISTVADKLDIGKSTIYKWIRPKDMLMN